ncbi:NAD(P)/FAD-dependent oxidoreductase [Sphingobium ummariense]
MRCAGGPDLSPAASVAIRGSGVAASACAHLLTRAGLRVASEGALRPPVPSIMLSEAALALLRDIFGRPDLFADRPRVRRRLVAWGGRPVVVPHDAVLLSEDDLQSALAPLAMAIAGEADFTIFAAPPLPEGSLRLFGDRGAVAARVTVRSPACAQECRVEAVPAGWLFLVPAGEGEGWLMGIGAPLDALLADSALIAPVIDMTASASQPFITAPRIHAPLCGEGWLACGTAAIGFDPICGDGTAQSVREAILASAVLSAIAEGADAAPLLTHYRSMLIAAMRRHLQLCAHFYGSGGQGDWWRAQHAALVEGHGWCTAQLAKLPEPQFLLDGFRLVPRQAAA